MPERERQRGDVEMVKRARRAARPAVSGGDSPPSLAADHATSIAFLDESGIISRDRFFSVGCLKLAEPSLPLRQLQKLRDRYHWYAEIHFTGLTRDTLPFYTEVVNLVALAEVEFSCFVADRQVADPVARFRSPWKAYERLAEQLLIGSIRVGELVTVLADNYSTPDDVIFEQDVRTEVNRRLGRLAVTSVCRLDSKAADPLQLVDLLTCAVTFEFRQAAGLAGLRSAKADLAAQLRGRYGVKTFLKGFRSPPAAGSRLNVAIYRNSASQQTEERVVIIGE